ncbi:hypothetical protein RDI58_024476 [Solanum bulbocastanum]|uniref:FH2 domain-containing protein n=1 Tax=Solanum bulbocastanum TaxID=147425 RepID=A0AAN8T516_SOLBU
MVHRSPRQHELLQVGDAPSPTLAPATSSSETRNSQPLSPYLTAPSLPPPKPSAGGPCPPAPGSPLPPPIPIHDKAGPRLPPTSGLGVTPPQTSPLESNASSSASVEGSESDPSKMKLNRNELPSKLLQTFLKMAPTADEELKLRLYIGDLSRVGPVEQFLKVLVDIPFSFKRLESLLFICSLEEEASMAKESFATLEVR